jgi:hypothetical protein
MPRKGEGQITQPKEFELQSELRSQQYQKDLQEKLQREQEELERQRCFKA